MKVFRSLFILLFFANCAQGALPPACPAPATHSTPAEFASRSEAEAFAGRLFTGGRVEMLRVGEQTVMLLYVYGSGLPDIAIVAYQASAEKWVRVSEVSPMPGALGDAHQAVVEGSAVIIVSGASGPKCVLLGPGSGRSGKPGRAH